MSKMIENYVQIPSDSWWYITRNELIYFLIKKYSSTTNPEILDMGCGCGVLLDYLKTKGIDNVEGVDFQDFFIEHALTKGRKVKLYDIENGINFDKKYDVIVLSDVLEHLNDDKKAVNNIFSILKDNGICIVFVPAFMVLWSWHDVVNEHKRRYSLKELIKLFKNSGFSVSFYSYWNFFLFIPTFFIRAVKRMFKIKTDDFYNFPKLINLLIILLIRIENFLIVRAFRLPFGVSILCVATKKV